MQQSVCTLWVCQKKEKRWCKLVGDADNQCEEKDHVMWVKAGLGIKMMMRRGQDRTGLRPTLRGRDMRCSECTGTKNTLLWPVASAQCLMAL